MSWPPDGASGSSSRGRAPPSSPNPQTHQQQQQQQQQQQLSPQHGLHQGPPPPPPPRPHFFFGGPPLHSLSLPPPGSHQASGSSPGAAGGPLLSPTVLYQDHGSPSSSSQGSTSSVTTPGSAAFGAPVRGSSPSTLVGAASGSSASSPLGRPYKVCGVCGDRAKSYHFGGISCDSCKAFFRRSVQNEAYRNFHCPYDGRCEITIGSRKCCQYCRFHKCLSIGMEKGWVMTEEERMQLLKNRMEKKQRGHQGSDCVSMTTSPSSVSIATSQGLVAGTSGGGGVIATVATTAALPGTATDKRRTYKASSGSAGGESSGSTDHEPDLSDLSKYLNNEDVELVERLVNAYETSYRSIPLVPSRGGGSGRGGDDRGRSRTDILEMFFTVIKQFAHFARHLDSFHKLPGVDQEVLLRCGVLELCFIRGAHVFDEQNLCWPDRSRPLYRDSAVLTAQDLNKLVSPELHDKHLRFVASMKDMELDEPTIMLLIVIVLLSPDRPDLVRGDVVSQEQERYYILLRRYMTWRYGAEMAATIYPKLLLKLPDLRELSDAHTDFHLRLEKEEMEEIQQRLSLLQVHPSHADGATGSAAVSLVLPTATWTLRSYLATLVPPSPGSLEDDSSSSDNSDRSAASFFRTKDI